VVVATGVVTKPGLKTQCLPFGESRRSPYWFGCFTLPDGRRTQRSTKTANRREAFKIASESGGSGPAAADGIAGPPGSVRYPRTDSWRAGCPPHRGRLRRPMAGSEKRRDDRRNVQTLRAHRPRVPRLARRQATQPIHYVTPAVVATWRQQSRRESTPRTANNKLKIVRNLFQTAWREWTYHGNPAAKVQRSKAVGGNRRPFTLDELTILLGVASQEWRGMILAGAVHRPKASRTFASLTWAKRGPRTDEFRFATSKTGVGK